ncbi:ATP-binding protein [Bacteroidota bacterium]
MNTITNADTNVVRPRRIAITLIAGSMIIPVIGLLGWLSKALLLASFGLKNIPMAPSTAICFILLGSSLLMMLRPSLAKFWVIVIGVTGISVALYGLLTFVGLNTELPIINYNLLFPNIETLDGIPIGRMASSTSMLFLLSGISLLFTLAISCRVKQASSWKFWAALSGGIVLFTGFIFFIAHLINSPLFYVGGGIAMALTTSITFMLLGSGLLMVLNSQTNIFYQNFTMLKNAKIGTQLKLGFATIFIFVILLGTVSFLQIKKLNLQTQYLYNHPFSVATSLRNFRSDIFALQREIKDLYLITDEKDISGEIDMIEWWKLDASRNIDTIYSNYLGPRSDVEILEKKFNEFNTVCNETIRLIHLGDYPEVFELIKPNGIIGSKAKILFEKLLIIDNFAENKSIELYATSIKLKNSLNGQLLFLITIIVLILMLISRFLILAVRKPIEHLIDATHRFHTGDLTARSPYTSHNEFGELSNSYNALAEHVQIETVLNEKVIEFAKLMLSKYDVKEFFQETINTLAAFTTSQMAAIYLLSNDKKIFEHFESFGVDDNAKQSFTADSFEGEFGTVLSTQKIQHIKSIPEDTRFIYYSVSCKFIPREIISIPIVSNKEVVAIISLASVNIYSQHSLQFIDRILVTLNARIEGILAYHKINEVLDKMEHQNRELEASKMELSSQSTELIEQNLELELQKKQLSQANQLKTSFFSNMSHELRTPLNSVIALSGVLYKRLANKISKEEYSYIEIIKRNGKNLLSLINDILDIARIEAGHEDIEIIKFNNTDLIDDIVNPLSIQANQKKIKLVHSKTDPNLFITSDVKKCRHILQNIISNAVKFTEKGKVEVYEKQNDDTIVITVTDTGIGISEDQLTYIFDEFKQADNSTSRKFGGTGLGLAIAKKYANMLGGHISVKSEIDKGSEFTLILPLQYASENRIVDAETSSFFKHSSTQSSLQPELQTIKGKPVVLIVEDNPDNMLSTRAVLADGFTVLEAVDGIEGVEMAKKFKPNLILMDIALPNMDGIEAFKTIRNDPALQHIKIIALTASAMIQDREIVLAHGFDAFIPKPIDEQEFFNTINRTLYGK